MVLQLLPLTVEDFPTIIDQANTFPIGDDLVGPPVPVCWPVSTREKAQTRLRTHMQKQRDRLAHDRSTRYLKVVDVESGAIVSVARWHWYPTGYSYENEAHWEIYGRTGMDLHEPPWPKEFNISMNNFILGSRDAARPGWIGEGRPCWILMHLVTRPSQRGKGAARLLVEWGIEQAMKTGAPAYLEAGVMGMPIYEKMGFRQVGELMELDLGRFGLESTFVMAKMAYLVDRGEPSSE